MIKMRRLKNVVIFLQLIELKIRQLRGTNCLENFSSEKMNNTLNNFEPDFSKNAKQLQAEYKN